jgi:hypothetical protein
VANPFRSRIRKPVRRGSAENYILLTLLTFAGSVALTRLFLEVTRYPQLGRGELHVAHVLWGGLFLFIAALLPVIWINRWIYTVSSILAGIGVGLFIDEVGKFITQSSNYFHPAAAPIVYAFFLLTVVVYLQVRRGTPEDARSALYWALDALSEVLDSDLEPIERQAIETRLLVVIDQDENEDFTRLARHLIDFVNSDTLTLAPEEPGLYERVVAWWEKFESKWLTLPRLKAALVGGLIALGALAVYDLFQLSISIQNPTRLSETITDVVLQGKIASTSGLFWFLARVVLEGLVGATLILAAGLLIFRRERLGIFLAVLGLLLSLTVVNLFVFYFEQFSSIFPALVQALLLLGAISYRRRLNLGMAGR